jgi:hypothetical protein
MKRLYILLPISLILFGATLLVHNYVSAQGATQGLEISPPSQEVTIDPGATKIIKAKIRNRSNATLPMKVHIEDFTAKGEEGQVELNANSPYSVTSWTIVSPTAFKLGPGEEREVTATIKAPADAAGGHFGSFVFAAEADKPKGNAATLSQQIASLFLIRVSGPVDEKMMIKEFKAPDYSEFGPVPLSIKFTNNGNVHVKAYGLINVTDMFNKKVADIVVPSTNVFPGAERAIHSSLEKKLLVGPYKATAIMYYGSTQNQTLTATTTFFVFPTRIIVGILIVLLLLFFLRKRFKKIAKALSEK